MPAKGDVVRVIVIGTGVLGASAAFHLARSGAEVIAIDAQRDGRATAAGAGIICPWVSGIEDEAFYRLYAGGGEYYAWLTEALAENGETELGYRRSGALLVSDDAAECAAMARFALGRRVELPAMGTVSHLSAKEARELFPPLHADMEAVHVSGGARVDGRLLAAALLRAAQAHGAEIMTAVAEPRAERGRVRGARVEARQIEADRVIVTAGAWADRLLRGVGATVPVQPQRGQIVHLRLDGWRPKPGRSFCRPAAITSCHSTAAGSSWARHGKPTSGSTTALPRWVRRRCCSRLCALRPV